jgi:alkanesulfonate monooxygenase SsuD/methylene tetrahydromethanopterin reductase-like flavin-dependent oxidoreductase (luciferase family)
MQFGTYYFLQATPDRSAEAIIAEEVEQMVLSERLGFDAVWLTEHHYADYGISSAPSVLLATVAARTERVKLGMAVWVLPFHNPLRLAEETATLDILSRGRLVVGLGRGNRPQEFLGHGVNQDESRTRMEEGVEVLLKAWTEERVTFQGRHWQFDEIPIYPKPFTKPHPPLAFAVTSPQSLEWAGAHGYPIMSSGLTTPRASLEQARETYIAAPNQRSPTCWGNGSSASTSTSHRPTPRPAPTPRVPRSGTWARSPARSGRPACAASAIPFGSKPRSRRTGWTRCAGRI